jgi:hypothetical protein
MAKGLVFIHQAPAALIPHVEWTLAGISANPADIHWHKSVNVELSYWGVASYSGDRESGSTLASAFMNLKQLIFEITQERSASDPGYRWSFTPQLGMFQSSTDDAGNLLVSENQIRAAMERSGPNPLKLQRELRKLIGQSWDDELEQFRERVLVIGTEGNDGIVSAEAEGITNRQNIRSL